MLFGTSRKPTIERAIARVRSDPDARFAAVLAATFAFSFGFVVGFLIAGSASASGGDEEGRGA